MNEQFDSQFFALQEALAGRYSLETELGRGGMGIVYLAHEVQLDRPVAIKVLPEHLSKDPALRERFLREARTAAKLSHPNIIPIHSVDEVGEFVYFAMAYVNGETLGERVRRQGPLPPSTGQRLLKEVAWALSYAHSQGVVHRDVKPDNILLEEGTGRALVADFGIAGLLEGASATGVGEVLGTAEFMSPEQASGSGVDARSDIYSLGVVGFYALSAQLPFTHDDTSEVLRQHLEDIPPQLKTVGPHVPSRLARCVDRCLLKNPEGRFESASSLAESLDASTREGREIPVAVRNFIKDPIDLPGDGVTYFSFSLATVLGLSLGVGGQGPLWSLIMATFGGIVLTPPAVLVTMRIRQLLRAGHTREDLIAALRQELESRREELAYAHGVEPSRLERMAFSLAYGSTIGGISFALFSAPTPALACLGTSAVSGILGALLRSRRIDHKAERRFKFWKGKFASWLFKAANIKLGGKALPMRPTHRATELQIGFAVDGLYEQLPGPVRQQLGDVPSVARQLESDAQLLRQSLEQLNEAVSTAQASSSDAPRDLIKLRDTTKDRLAEVVASLETIRLGLLRLSIGSGSVESLTTDLAAAAGVGDDIDRLMDGMADVELLLRPT